MKVLTQDNAGQLSLVRDMKGCPNPIAEIFVGLFIPILLSSGHYICMSLPAVASACKLFFCSLPSPPLYGKSVALRFQWLLV